MGKDVGSVDVLLVALKGDELLFCLGRLEAGTLCLIRRDVPS